MTAPSTDLLRQVRQLAAASLFGQWTDQQLLERFAAGRDETAFALLMRRHGSMVLGVCRRLLGHEQDAEDAFQAAFLLLARKAGSIRQTNVGGWLFRVAYRVAIRARARTSKRQQLQQRGATLSTADPLAEATWSELRQVVDEELQRLPDDLRSALVLCYLEGKTQEDAARLLGWSKGTLRRRLDQGRERLRTRLLKRGLAPMAALTASLFADNSMSAAVSATLANATLRTALGSAAAPAIVALAEGGLGILGAGKIKAATAVVLLMSVLTGAGLWALHTMPSPIAAMPQGEAKERAEKANPSALREETRSSIEVRGRVLDPDGKPKAGAKLLLLGPVDQSEQQELLLEKSGKVRQVGVSSADGRFTVAVPKEATNRSGDSYLIVQADGSGMDFLELYQFQPGKPVELHLVKDNMIRGRVVNTEGKPVAGVRVAVNHLEIYPNNSLDSFLVFWKNRPFKGTRGDKSIYSGAGAVLAATTDAGGRFVLHGVGAERLVTLRLSGGGIAAEEVWRVVNRAGFDPKPYNQAMLDNLPKGERGLNGRWILSGPDVSVVVAAEKVIRGTVTEADTGKVRPGVIVRLTRKNGDDHTGGEYLSLRVQAKTDAKGRYEIRGADKAKSYLVAVSSDSATGYLGRGVWAQDTPGYQPVTADIRVRKGVIVTGKLIDGTTGKPLDGSIVVADLSDNPYVKEYSEGSFHSVLLWAMDYRGTDADGVFRTVTIPGPVLLMGKAYGNWSLYKSAIPDPNYPQYFEKERNFYRYRGSGSTIVQGNFCKVLRIKPGVAVVEQDIVLERQNVLGVIKIQDAEGRPLSEVNAWGAANRIEGDTCTVYGEVADRPRFLVFYAAKRKLAGTLTLKAGEKLPQFVKLRPMGSVKGRLLDADGKPLAGIVIDPHYDEDMGNGMHGRLHEFRPIASDANGAFILDSLIPELAFELSFGRGKRKFNWAAKPVDPTIQVKPGETKDVGDLKIKPMQ